MAVMSCTAGQDVLRQALQHHDCIVLMKVYGRFGAIYSLLDEMGLIRHAILMANASMENETLYSNLSDIRADTPLPYFSTILVNKSHIPHA